MPISLTDLEEAIRCEWCAETAWNSASWDPTSPAGGQCFSTSFVLASLLGGHIVHADLVPRTQSQQRHSWVRLPSGLEIDITAEQFDRDQQFQLCELPEDLVWSTGGRQAELLLAKVRQRLEQSRPET